MESKYTAGKNHVGIVLIYALLTAAVQIIALEKCVMKIIELSKLTNCGCSLWHFGVTAYNYRVGQKV